MIFANINQFKMGWFIGDFEPTLLKNRAFEVAHHTYKKGFQSAPHTHWVATEYNYIVSGSLIAGGKTLGRGDIFVYEPGEISDVTFLEDTDLIIIKNPSAPGDKHEIVGSNSGADPQVH